MRSKQSVGAQANLKRTITLPQALGVAFHQVVGGGVVALMGVAIAMTGSGTPLAFVIAAVAVIIYSIPIATLASAMPVVGGRYTYGARVFSPTVGFVAMWFAVLVTIQLSLMALAGAAYAQSLWPSLPARPVAFVFMTVFFVANLFGAAFSSRVGILLGFIMLAAFGLYGVTGLGHVQWTHFSEFTPQGVGGLLSTAALLTFATTGAVAVSDLGGEMKRPGRDIPVSVVGATAFAAVLYVLVAIPSIGVLGPQAAANKTMTAVAEVILSPSGAAFFVIGGALCAVVGHINSLLLAATKPVLAAIDDGWLPAGLGAVNKRYGTPHWLLTVLYVVGVAPVLLGFSVEAVAGMASIATGPILAILVAASWRLRTRSPRQYAAAPFKLSRGVHLACTVTGGVVLVVQTYLLIGRLTPQANLAFALWALLGVGVWALRHKKVRHLAPSAGPRAERRPADAPVPQAEPPA
ncbi:APC family permease [Streptomyces sp. NBC_01221]|uniref:APC family permease n=1 Tax=Streptomyces sp. NBC_01221 TaxID=2903782 RepID=UPI00224FD7C1|nr:APC family permease [Streptomyces sp. NBC_01221]MCX4792313.1 APC family permease [Streptomyces sp. NBC_01221]